MPSGGSERNRLKEIPAKILIGLLRFYKSSISPFLRPTCRFSPTCSEYMLQAVQNYGFLKGIWMGIRRLMRCHPFNPGGYDPVPERKR